GARGAPADAEPSRRASRLTATTRCPQPVDRSPKTTGLQPPLPSHPVLRLRPTPHTVVLLSAGRGRWDRVVVPRYTTEDAAKPLMAAAAGDLGAG
ncbi:hypothetical protein ACFT2A_38915, partial [Streptomyces sp. NPDC057072]